MKSDLSKTEAKEKIDNFFLGQDFSSGELIKIKRLAMKFNIKLGSYKKMFCKKCLNKLAGKIRISKGFKMIECEKCGFKNKYKLV